MSYLSKTLANETKKPASGGFFPRNVRRLAPPGIRMTFGCVKRMLRLLGFLKGKSAVYLSTKQTASNGSI